MGFLRTFGFIVLGFFLGLIMMAVIAALVLVVPNPLHGLFPTQQQQQPVEAWHSPAGLLYEGPSTTAIAGYYCVYGANVAGDTGQWGGYSVQLNAELSNGYWVQSVWGPFYVGTPSNAVYGPEYVVYYGNNPITLGPSPPITSPPCGWLVIAVHGNTVYFGYSRDGNSIDWFGSYVMNASGVIVPGYSQSGIVVAGPGLGEGVTFNYLNASLALYYWNGTQWLPAESLPAYKFGDTATTEWVSNAYVFASNNCASVTWPVPSNTTACPPPPSFSP